MSLQKSQNSTVITDQSDLRMPASVSDFEITDEENNQIVKSEIKSTGKEILGDFLRLGSLVKLFTIKDRVEKESRNLRMEKAINSCLMRAQNSMDAYAKIMSLATSKTGNILFNKFLLLTDNIDPENDEYIGYFSRVLTTIIESDFERNFEKHNYCLSVINSLSIQALVILIDCQKWKVFNISGHYSYEEGMLTSQGWRSLFVEAYLADKVITTSYDEVKERVRHSLAELERQELIVPKVIGKTDTRSMSDIKDASNQKAELQLTQTGADIVSYLKD